MEGQGGGEAQGVADPKKDEFAKNSPKMWPKKMRATFVIFQKLSEVNNQPMGENCPNLVTLFIDSHRERRRVAQNGAVSTAKMDCSRLLL
jgi:hypothetical protein